MSGGGAMSRQIAQAMAAACVAAILLVRTTSAAEAAAGERVNVALAEWGTTATASSEYGPAYRAGNVLDGRWARRETDKWNSAANKVPHWLKIDLGRAYRIDRIVVRHEGGGRGDRCTTADFRLQRSDGPDGPWADLCDPVKGNTKGVTQHGFDAVATRYLRLFITKAEQNANTYGRIFEVEVYSADKGLKLSVPDITLAEKLVRDAKAGKLGTGGLDRAAEQLDHKGPFVRALAEWAIALKMGRDNNKQTAAWPKEQSPAWYRKWTALPLDRMVEADWVRQAVSLGIHRDARKLVASADEMLGRGERLVADLGSRGSAGAGVGRQVALLKDIRGKMQGASSDLASLRGLWIEARRALRPIVFANRSIDFDKLVLYTRFAPHHKPNVCGVHTTWTYKPGGDICILSGLESGGRVRSRRLSQVGIPGAALLGRPFGLDRAAGRDDVRCALQAALRRADLGEGREVDPRHAQARRDRRRAPLLPHRPGGHPQSREGAQ